MTAEFSMYYHLKFLKSSFLPVADKLFLYDSFAKTRDYECSVVEGLYLFLTAGFFSYCQNTFIRVGKH